MALKYSTKAQNSYYFNDNGNLMVINNQGERTSVGFINESGDLIPVNETTMSKYGYSDVEQVIADFDKYSQNKGWEDRTEQEKAVPPIYVPVSLQSKVTQPPSSPVVEPPAPPPPPPPLPPSGGDGGAGGGDGGSPTPPVVQALTPTPTPASAISLATTPKLNIVVRDRGEGGPQVFYTDSEGNLNNIENLFEEGESATQFYERNPDIYKQVLSASPVDFNNYDSAANAFAREKQPWNYSTVEGLSTREPFSINAIWGGSQYQKGRVSSLSDINSSQTIAQNNAGKTRDELWNIYNQLASQGRTPPKNPDQIALDIYVQSVGKQGNALGYGPGVNTLALNEYIKGEFLNQPEIVSVTGNKYYTPQEKIPEIQAFGEEHKNAANTWAVFEQQGMSGDSFLTQIIRVAAAAMLTGDVASAMNSFIGNITTAASAGTIPFSAQTTMLAAQTAGMSVSESIFAAAAASGTINQATGGNFIDGFIAGGTSAALTAGVSESGATQKLSSVIKEVIPGTSSAVADRMASAIVSPVQAATGAALRGEDPKNAALSAIAGQGFSAAGDVIADAAKAIARDVEAKVSGLPTAYTEGRMYAGADTGTMTDVPFGGTVTGGLRAYTAESAPENLSIPSNTRLATYDEATSGNAMLQDLPSGEKAYLIGVQQPSPAAFQSFWDKISNIGALLAIGKPSIGAQKYTLFGSGATPGAKEGFSLFSFDDPAKQQEALRYIEMVQQQPDTTPQEKQIAEDVKKAISTAPVLTPEEVQKLIETEPTITETQKQPSKVVAGGGDVGAEAGAAAAPSLSQLQQQMIARGMAYQLPSTIKTTQEAPAYEGAADIQVPSETAYGTGGYESVGQPSMTDAFYREIYGKGTYPMTLPYQVIYESKKGVGDIPTDQTEFDRGAGGAGFADEGDGIARGKGDVGGGESDAGTGGGEGGGVGGGTGAGEGEGEGGTGEDTTRKLMNFLFKKGQSFQYTGESGGDAGTEGGAYLGRGITEGTTGEPILGVKGKRKPKVWNIESLRDALGV